MIRFNDFHERCNYQFLNMKNQLLLLLLLTTILSLSASAQISFEKGYFINNSGKKIDCLIKNIEWRNNPTGFEYKLVQNGEVMNENLNTVKEFGIFNNLKYLRTTVKIDKSADDLNNMSYDKNPVFVEEQFFLKVLVEGKANLYLYVEGSLQRFFFNKDNSKIEQLVFKNFRNSEGQTGENNQFRQQLWNDLKCPNISINKILNLKYQKNALVTFIKAYNECNDSEFVNYDEKRKKDLFNLSVRPRLNNTSLFMKNLYPNSDDIDFGNKSNFSIGVEAEFIMPYNKNKWAFTIEPNYQKFNSKKEINGSLFSSGKQIATVNYNYIEMPLSVRHYFFLNDNGKFFVNASYIFALASKSSLEFTRAPDIYLNSVKLSTRAYFGFGAGYKFKNRYSLEVRFNTSRNLTENYIFWNSKCKTSSLIFGYSLF